MDEAKLVEAEDFLDQIETLRGFVPANADPSVEGCIRQLLIVAHDMIASALDAQTLSDIREYWDSSDRHFDEKLAYDLVASFLDKAHDSEADPDLEWFSYPKQLGLETVLDAPAETPAEFVLWLVAAHRARFDGAPCVRCGKPVPYDDLYLISDWRGRRYFHPECGHDQSREEHPNRHEQTA